MQKRLIILLLLLPLVSAECSDLIDGSIINTSTTLCSDTYDIPNGITIIGNNLIFDCNTAVLRGNMGSSEIGIMIENSTNVTLKNCNIVTFNQALFLNNVTHSLIEGNGFLKGRIGVRMYEAYENILRDNLDKSREFPISAVSSKFNVVMLGNRNIDHNFCAVNSCNEERIVNVCIDDDFYCSSSCTADIDSDCRPLSQKFEPVGLPDVSGKSVDDFRREVEAEFNTLPEPEVELKEGFSSNLKIALYGGSALLVLLALSAFLVSRRV